MTTEISAFVIMGDSGRYDDQRTWVVKVVSTEVRAEELVKKMNDILTEHKVHAHLSNPVYLKEEQDVALRVLLNDPEYSTKMYGTDYHWVEIPCEV